MPNHLHRSRQLLILILIASPDTLLTSHPTPLPNAAISQPSLDPNICQGQSDGRYITRQCANGFYNCSGGLAEFHSCPDLQVLDATRGGCVNFSECPHMFAPFSAVANVTSTTDSNPRRSATGRGDGGLNVVHLLQCAALSAFPPANLKPPAGCYSRIVKDHCPYWFSSCSAAFQCGNTATEVHYACPDVVPLTCAGRAKWSQQSSCAAPICQCRPGYYQTALLGQTRCVTNVNQCPVVHLKDFAIVQQLSHPVPGQQNVQLSLIFKDWNKRVTLQLKLCSINSQQSIYYGSDLSIPGSRAVGILTPTGVFIGTFEDGFGFVHIDTGHPYITQDEIVLHGGVPGWTIAYLPTDINRGPKAKQERSCSKPRHGNARAMANPEEEEEEPVIAMAKKVVVPLGVQRSKNVKIYFFVDSQLYNSIMQLWNLNKAQTIAQLDVVVSSWLARANEMLSGIPGVVPKLEYAGSTVYEDCALDAQGKQPNPFCGINRTPRGFFDVLDKLAVKQQNALAHISVFLVDGLMQDANGDIHGGVGAFGALCEHTFYRTIFLAFPTAAQFLTKDDSERKFLHELAHIYGAAHDYKDPNDLVNPPLLGSPCRPWPWQGGDFLMAPTSGQVNLVNNNKLSPCSLTEIQASLGKCAN